MTVTFLMTSGVFGDIGEIADQKGTIQLLAQYIERQQIMIIIMPCKYLSLSGKVQEKNIHCDQEKVQKDVMAYYVNLQRKESSNQNIATGKTSQAITPFHFFDNFNFHH